VRNQKRIIQRERRGESFGWRLPRCGSPGALFRARSEDRELINQRKESIRTGGSQRKPRYHLGRKAIGARVCDPQHTDINECFRTLRRSSICEAAAAHRAALRSAVSPLKI